MHRWRATRLVVVVVIYISAQARTLLVLKRNFLMHPASTRWRAEERESETEREREHARAVMA